MFAVFKLKSSFSYFSRNKLFLLFFLLFFSSSSGKTVHPELNRKKPGKFAVVRVCSTIAAMQRVQEQSLTCFAGYLEVTSGKISVQCQLLRYLR